MANPPEDKLISFPKNLNPFPATNPQADYWTRMKNTLDAISGNPVIHNKGNKAGLFDYLTLFSFYIFDSLFLLSISGWWYSIRLVKRPFQPEIPGENIPWYHLGLGFIAGLIGSVMIFGPIFLASCIIGVSHTIVRYVFSYALTYLNPLTYLGVGLVHLYYKYKTPLHKIDFADILNPFGGLIEIKDRPHARTLRTTWWGKMLDTFAVIGGYPISKKDKEKKEENRQKNPTTNLGLSHRIGLFDLLIVPALVAFLARKCEDALISQNMFSNVLAALCALVLGPLHWIINGLIRPLVSAVLTFNPVTAIFVGLVSGITSIYQLIKYDGLTQEKAAVQIEECITSSDDFKALQNEEKKENYELKEIRTKVQGPSPSYHVMYTAQFQQIQKTGELSSDGPFSIEVSSSFAPRKEIIIEPELSQAQAAKLLIDMDVTDITFTPRPK